MKSKLKAMNEYILIEECVEQTDGLFTETSFDKDLIVKGKVFISNELYPEYKEDSILFATRFGSMKVRIENKELVIVNKSSIIGVYVD